MARDAQRCFPALRTLRITSPAMDRPRVREMPTLGRHDNER
ncbi:hypothetical protein PP509_gp68 [Gordonia phage MichaelScott]|uniref:Uncharacterized protein n=1 Tax=Gordonia phage MichaelScott TaxID=2759395 RepID=A0A7L7SJI8_9CAUD|nr:hypothetical protein PP509_gp68 [Gordonia phage MichaelScott]QOC56310.1 hypothetical protein SEA_MICHAELSCOTT_68 [Gordonia phage MichaelScott]